MEVVQIRRSLGPSRSETKSSQKYALEPYLKPPEVEIGLSNFAEMAQKRYNLLKELENAEATRAQDPSSSRLRDLSKFRAEIDDVSSHFALRLISCSEEQSRQPFLRMETLLFKARCEQALEYNMGHLLEECARELSIPELKEVGMAEASKLISAGLVSSNDRKLEKAYVLPFTSVLEHVKSRQCIVEAGQALISPTDLAKLLSGEFRKRLSGSLALMQRRLANVVKSPRFRPIYNQIWAQNAVVPNAITRGAELTGKQLPDLSETSFPMCMSTMMQGLKHDGKLTHSGRLQFILFLKAAGLPLQEAVQFLRAQFAKTTPGDKFDKEFVYLIRFLYGQEGKQMNYSAYGCYKISMNGASTDKNRKPGEHHGCPFVRFTGDGLRIMIERKLEARGPPDRIQRNEYVRDILEKCENRQPDAACALMFQATHMGHQLSTLATVHPNSYFNESQDFWTQQRTLELNGTASSQPSKSSTTSSSNSSSSSSSAN